MKLNNDIYNEYLDTPSIAIHIPKTYLEKSKRGVNQILIQESVQRIHSISHVLMMISTESVACKVNPDVAVKFLGSIVHDLSGTALHAFDSWLLDIHKKRGENDEKEAD
jgi:hypothetical protein